MRQFVVQLAIKHYWALSPRYALLHMCWVLPQTTAWCARLGSNQQPLPSEGTPTPAGDTKNPAKSTTCVIDMYRIIPGHHPQSVGAPGCFTLAPGAFHLIHMLHLLHLWIKVPISNRQP